MKRILMSIGLVILMSSLAHAAPYRSVYSVKSATNDTVFNVPSTTTVYTRSFSIKDVQNTNDMGVMYKVTQDGTIALTLALEQSFQPPTTEGAVDATYLETHIIEAGIADDKWSLATVDTVTLPYGRFKVTGTGSNSAGTMFQIKVAK